MNVERTPLPPEICQLIIGFLDDRNHREIARCGLVARSWVLGSRHHLFLSVVLCRENINKFLALVQSQYPPTFLRSVRDLYYNFPHLWTARHAPHPQLEDILNVLPLLPAVKYIFISGKDIQTTGSVMSTKLPNVIDLDLTQTWWSNSIQLFKLISSVTNLERLSLDNVACQNSEVRIDPLDFPRIPSSLHSLQLHSMSGVDMPMYFAWLLSSGSHPFPPKIRHLSIAFPMADALNLFQTYCESFGEHVNELELVMDLWVPLPDEHSSQNEKMEAADFFRRANFSSLPDLKHLHVTSISCADSDEETWIFDLLRLISTPLDTLELDINNDKLPPMYEEPLEPEDSDAEEDDTLPLLEIHWSTFRTIFSIPQLSGLRKLTINLTSASPAAKELVLRELQGTWVSDDVISVRRLSSEWPGRHPVKAKWWTP